MKIGSLQHRVALQQKTVNEDAIKQQSESWTDMSTMWARIEPLSGREYFAARQENAEITAKITIRYRPGINTDLRIVFDGRIFEVLSVVNPEERCKLLILMCKEVPV